MSREQNYVLDKENIASKITSHFAYREIANKVNFNPSPKVLFIVSVSTALRYGDPSDRQNTFLDC